MRAAGLGQRLDVHIERELEWQQGAEETNGLEHFWISCSGIFYFSPFVRGIQGGLNNTDGQRELARDEARALL